MAVDPPASDDQSEPRLPHGRGSLASWVEIRIWPGPERDAFLAWPEAEPSWESFAAWYRQEGMWR